MTLDRRRTLSPGVLCTISAETRIVWFTDLSQIGTLLSPSPRVPAFTRSNAGLPRQPSLLLWMRGCRAKSRIGPKSIATRLCNYLRAFSPSPLQHYIPDLLGAVSSRFPTQRRNWSGLASSPILRLGSLQRPICMS